MEKFTLMPSFVKREIGAVDKREGKEFFPLNPDEDKLLGGESAETDGEDFNGGDSLPKETPGQTGEKTQNGEERRTENEKEKKENEKASGGDNIEALLSFMRAHDAGTRRILDKNKKPPFSR